MDEGFQSSAFAQGISDKNRSSRSLDVEFGADIESGIALSADFSEYDGLRTFLDSNRDTMKLDAMKRIIRMVARGRDCAELFPAVVKNVVSKDPEIRKLVYIYLTRYAEEQQDTALLSVSTFQRSLKDPNQLIRASALRVLCSTRIPMLVPIMMLAINDASKDLSPYVRKTAAHAILKVYSLEPNEKEQLVEIIDRLLADKTTLVIGSTVRAFEEVCPERLDLIHRNYRKLCSLLMDVDEWGQVVLMNMLTRYARTQFLDPENKVVLEVNAQSGKDADLLSSSSRHEHGPEPAVPTAGAGDQHGLTDTTAPAGTFHADRTLITLSQVIVAAAQLLFALKSKEDYPAVAKALVRSLHGSMEVQYVLLSNIATLSINYPGLFEPYLRSFFCFTNDPLYIKLVKLDILSNLATETSCPTILREFQHYVIQPDPQFVTATIQAIGRCANAIPQIMDICLNGLVRLMSRPDEKIVAECVVVLRKLLQMQNSDHKEIIIRIAQLTDTMTVPSALASILWLLGEYSHRVPKIAPDVLRKMAKTFVSQESVVKLQVLNLAAKLAIVNPKQTHLLAQYVFTLARYDQNYDIRDRSRLLRALIFPQSLSETGSGDSGTVDTTESKPPVLGYLAKHARKICLAVKPAPVLQSLSKERSIFALGSLSHLLNHCVHGYRELPDWPVVPPNPWSRVVQSAGTPVVSTSSPASSVADRKLGSRSTQPRSLRDFFSDSEEEEEGNDEELEGEDLPENTIYDEEQEEEVDVDVEERNVSGEYISENDQNGASSNKKQDSRTKQKHQPWNDEESSEEIQSDLVELGAESVGSSSDSEFGLGPLEQLLRSNKPNHSSGTPERGSSDAAITSPGTTVTTEPSDSEERTFSSSALVATKLTSLTHSLLKASMSGDTETETDDTEDEEENEIRDPILLNAVPTHSVENDIEPKIPEPINNTLLENHVQVPPVNANESSGSCPLTLDNLQGTISEVSGTSSVTLPAITPSTSSMCESQKMSTISESPSIAIEPSLIRNVIDTTPTPLPTWDPGFSSDALDDELNYCSELPSVPVSLAINWKPSRDTLRWFEALRSKDSNLVVRYQFSRVVHKHNPNLVLLVVELSVPDDTNLCLTNVNLDLGSNVMGRLLLDANRIESFAPIERLSPGPAHYCSLGIDFAGFTDPIEVNLVYSTGPGASCDAVFSAPLLIAPPPGELIRPNGDNFGNEEQYMKLRDELMKSRCVDRSSKIRLDSNSVHFPDPTALITLILKTANVCYLGAAMCSNDFSTKTPGRYTAPLVNRASESSIQLRFSASTIAENQPCLVELQLKGGHWYPPPRVDTLNSTSALEVVQSKTAVDVTCDHAVNNEAVLTVFCSVHRIRIALCAELDVVFRDTFASPAENIG
ncbi:AP-3 complex subunit beta [Fasciola gigantica]|uniref:AP-3 complex subunit beta n=1 Tax=Fasciola gigantica TaxID=46835 RepID=A0A504XXM6_FASGI|nr:AP-3 complex subunit beta [Fasciola gigantica]